MTGFYENTQWVDEAEDFVWEDMAEDTLVIDEGEVELPETLMVEEDPHEHMMLVIPGSEKEFEEDKVEDERPKDWENDGDHSQFVSYVKDKMNKIPRHSGETVSGCERAKSFLKSLDSEISKALRSDLSGLIDESEVDSLRKSIGDMMDRLEKQIKKLKGSGKTANLKTRLVTNGHCEKCASVAPIWHDTENDKLVCLHCEAEDSADNLEKTAATPVLNVYMTPFERAIVGIMVNSKVSAGRNIEETYERLKNKYNFSPREELAIQQLVADYGYPVYKDRGLLNEEHDPASGDGVDFQSNYHA